MIADPLPELPPRAFARQDGRDATLCCVGAQYLRRPVTVLAEVRRA